MPRCVLPVQAPLNDDSSILIDGKLPLAVRSSIDGIRDLAFSALVRIRGFECLQTFPHLSIFVHRDFDIGLFKLGLIVIDVPQGNFDPGIGHMILVVIIVIPFVIHLDTETEALTLKGILIVQGLDNLERARPVVVSHHRKFIRPIAAIFKYL